MPPLNALHKIDVVGSTGKIDSSSRDTLTGGSLPKLNAAAKSILRSWAPFMVFRFRFRCCGTKGCRRTVVGVLYCHMKPEDLQVWQ